jgi:lipopolysaccharide export system protein LptA
MSEYATTWVCEEKCDVVEMKGLQDDVLSVMEGDEVTYLIQWERVELVNVGQPEVKFVLR